MDVKEVTYNIWRKSCQHLLTVMCEPQVEKPGSDQRQRESMLCYVHMLRGHIVTGWLNVAPTCHSGNSTYLVSSLRLFLKGRMRSRSGPTSSCTPTEETISLRSWPNEHGRWHVKTGKDCTKTVVAWKTCYATAKPASTGSGGLRPWNLKIVAARLLE